MSQQTTLLCHRCSGILLDKDKGKGYDCACMSWRPDFGIPTVDVKERQQKAAEARFDLFVSQKLSDSDIIELMKHYNVEL